MQGGVGIGAQAYNVARVGRDLGLEQDDVKHVAGSSGINPHVINSVVWMVKR
jgi:hypothetical protein